MPDKSSSSPSQIKPANSSATLNGAWRLRGRDPNSDKTHQLAASVPGNVHPELLREGIISDPFWRDQAEQCQWVEKWIWTYKREFEVGPGQWDSSWAVLEFEGLDTYATIRLNDREIGRTDNMFIAHRFEVSGCLQPGVNRIEVEFTPDSIIHADKDIAKYYSCFTKDRVYTRRMQCTYGWDWAHRFVGAGIWQPVQLHFYKDARVSDLYIQTLDIADQQARLGIELEVERRGQEALTALFEIRDPSGRSIWQQKNAIPETGPAKIECRLDDPQLWWPNGFGQQPIYELTASLIQGSETLEIRATTFGIRTVEIEEIPDEKGKSFTLKVNGERIFIKGGNWVPADPFPATIPPERYDRLISMAQRANMNLLRSWGGGIYEPEPFWQACDRTGVMISQDFLLACAAYPQDDPAFLAQLRVEFEWAIRRLRNHPSLAFWCGDNELGMNSPPESEYNGKKIAREISSPLCRQLDPSRPYRMTSPYGGEKNNSPLEGDCHRSAWYVQDFIRSDMSDYSQRIADLNGRLLSESTCMGFPPKNVLLRYLEEADLTDPERRLLEYHTKDNPYKRMDETTHLGMMETTASNLFGDAPNLDLRLGHLEYIHYEWVRLTTEALRRKKFDCSGIQYWMYNDIWPALGWSHVDYWGQAKAAFYADLQANKPVIATIEEHAHGWRVWLCNDLLKPIQGTVDIRVHGWAGSARWQKKITFDIAANISKVVCEIPKADLNGILDLQSVLVADTSGEFGTHRAWLHSGLPKQMKFPPVHLSISHERKTDCGTVRISTDNYARVVTLSGALDFSDNYFDLLPGETRTIEWSTPAGAHENKIHITCWNQAEPAAAE